MAREATVRARGYSSDTVTGVASSGLCGLFRVVWPVPFSPRLLPRPKRPRVPREATVGARGHSSDTVAGVASSGLCGFSRVVLPLSTHPAGNRCCPGAPEPPPRSSTRVAPKRESSTRPVPIDAPQVTGLERFQTATWRHCIGTWDIGPREKQKWIISRFFGVYRLRMGGTCEVDLIGSRCPNHLSVGRVR